MAADDAAPLASPHELPVINVAALLAGSQPRDLGAIAAVAAAIRDACLATGFFFVTGHGVSPDGLLRAAHKLFELPLGDKEALDANNSRLHRGYTGLGGSHNCVPAEACEVGPDQKESYLLGAEGDRSPMHGPNTWPEQLSGWRESIQAYQQDMLELSRVVARGLALSLELPEAFFADKLRDPVAQLLLLRYPPRPAGTEKYVGCGQHTDCGFLTILAQDDVPGLQVQMADGRWVTAPTIPGAFLVNLGDMTQAWTGGRYRSTQHRVFNSSTQRPRYSAPYFCNCDFDALVDPSALPGAAGCEVAGGEQQQQQQQPFTAGRYILRKLGLMWEDDSGKAGASA